MWPGSVIVSGGGSMSYARWGGKPPFFPSPPFPLLPPLRSRNPLIAARWPGGALKLPQQVQAEPSRQTYSGIK